MMNKNKFKKIAAIVCSAALTGALAFSLTACNNNDNNNDDGNDTNTTQDSVLLNKSTASVKVGETVTINVTSSPSGTITWSSSDTSVATVTADASNSKLATVSGLKVGTATITAKDGDLTATCTVTVTAASSSGGEENTETVTIDGAATQYIYGTDGTLTLTATASEGSAITWESSATSVATVANGVVTPVAAGETTITAKVSNDIKATVTVKVLAATNMEFATGVDAFSTGWRYFNGGVSEKTVSIHESYGDVGAKIKYSWGWVQNDEWWNVQLFYRNEGLGLIGKDHKVTLNVVASHAGDITVNGVKQTLKVGDNAVTVEHYNGITLAVAFGVEGKSCFAGTDVEFLIKDLVFETNTTATLETPEFTYDANSKVITINDDKNGDIENKGYRLIFFNAQNEVVTSLPVENGKAVTPSGIEGGTYTVRLQAYSESDKIVDSGWSTATASITIENDNVNLKDNTTDFTGKWAYFSANSQGAFEEAYAAPNKDLHVNNFVGGGDQWWHFQLIYKPEAGETLTGISFTVTSDHGGSITAAKDGTQGASTVYALTETAEGSGVYSYDFSINDISISNNETFVIWFCGFNDVSTRLSGNVTVSNIHYTYAGVSAD